MTVIAATEHRPEIALPELRPFIDGAFVDAASGRSFDVINPSSGEAFAQVQEADSADVDRAVKAARKALEGDWGKMNASARARLLRRFADLIEQNKEHLARLESLNNGKTYREALKGDLPSAWEVFHYYAGWCTKMRGETIPVDGPFLNYTLREPYGVCAQIIPWNFPLLMAAWKLAPALATGNTVILKPSEVTPVSVLELARLAQEAGFPPGVINVLPGFGQVAGEALARHPGIDKLAFTGSTRTARALLHASADTNLKKLSLELGGKSPHVVFEDADLKPAMNAALWGIFMNKGEVCAAGSRLLVHRSRYDELLEMLATRVGRMKVGDPFAPDTEMGAIVSERQMNTVLGYIQKGREQGARLVTGGERDAGDGYFVRPTIFADVNERMDIAQEEIFGPVLAVMPFDDEADAVRLANSTMYGLVAGVWTKDLGRAHRVARQIRSGTVWINDYNRFDAASPFGGYGQSGWGREMGEQAIELYTQTKSVWVRTDR